MVTPFIVAVNRANCPIIIVAEEGIDRVTEGGDDDTSERTGVYQRCAGVTSCPQGESILPNMPTPSKQNLNDWIVDNLRAAVYGATPTSSLDSPSV